MRSCARVSGAGARQTIFAAGAAVREGVQPALAKIPTDLVLRAVARAGGAGAPGVFQIYVQAGLLQHGGLRATGGLEPVFKPW